jgi:hypothetical protein
MKRIKTRLGLQLRTCLGTQYLQLFQRQPVLLGNDAGHVNTASGADLGKDLLMMREQGALIRIYRAFIDWRLLIAKMVLEDLADVAVEPRAVLHQTIGPIAYTDVRKNHGAVTTFPIQLSQCLSDRLKLVILV